MLSLLTSALLAATISSSTCSASVTTGCVTSYLGTSTALAVQVSGTWVGTLEFEGSVDGASYVPLRGYPVGGGAYTTSTTSNGAWTVLAGGLRYVRVRASAWTSGTATVTQAATSASAVATVMDVGAVQSSVDVSGTVSLDTPDAGLPVAFLSEPTVRVANAPDTSIEVSGQLGGPVQIEPTAPFELGASSLASLTAASAAPTCGSFRGLKATIGPLGRKDFPVLPDGGTTQLAERTLLSLTNHSSGNKTIHCGFAQPDAGTCSDTYPGYCIPVAAGESLEGPYNSTWRVHCYNPSPDTTVNVSTLEAGCIP